MADKKSEYEELQNLYYFSDLYKFIKESAGFAITIAYLVLILSSMAYLHVLYSSFDVSIIKLLTLEDILATPIKNPNIILVFAVIVFVFYIIDIGNRFNARLNLKYAEVKAPWYIRLLKILVWSPRTLKGNIRMAIFMAIFFLAIYVVIFAAREAKSIEQGHGSHIRLTLSEEGSEAETVTLLGATTHFVIVYSNEQERARIYQIESVSGFEPIIQEKKTPE